MFKYVLLLTFAVSVATAATIMTSASCNSETTFGTYSASCADSSSNADADIFASSIVDSRMGPIIGEIGVAVDAMVSPPGCIPPPGGFPPPSCFSSALASASFSNDYVFTVLGGTGAGFFDPSFQGRQLPGATASITFGETGANRFIFGLPQRVRIDMFGEAGVADEQFRRMRQADETLTGFQFFDQSGNPFTNVHFTLVAVPEPSGWSLLGIGLIFFLAVAIRRTPQRERFHQDVLQPTFPCKLRDQEGI